MYVKQKKTRIEKRQDNIFIIGVQGDCAEKSKEKRIK